nr:succinate dehydrogenase subunit 7A, mitochondrial-like isoform X1 [Ipomoea batatas]
MAFSVGKSALSQLRLYSQKADDSSSVAPRRGLHIEPGAREKALLADDSSLRRFKSNTKSVRTLKRVGDVLTVVVVAGCCYEIYVKAIMREEARKKASGST